MNLVYVDCSSKTEKSKIIGELAVTALIQEAKVGPKPGLVDRFDNGSHDDLSIDLMIESAKSLQDTFEKIAYVSMEKEVSQQLREEIAMIGRDGEAKMFAVTNGVNTHKGAIWALGLITSAYALTGGEQHSYDLLKTAGEIASFTDRNYVMSDKTNGDLVRENYGIHGAKSEAEEGFPSIRHYGLPAFEKALNHQSMEKTLLNSLLNLITNVDDTCILHRGGMNGLHYAKQEARKTLHKGVTNSELFKLNKKFIQKNISPGGSADLLAAIIYLHLLSGNIEK